MLSLCLVQRAGFSRAEHESRIRGKGFYWEAIPGKTKGKKEWQGKEAKQGYQAKLTPRAILVISLGRPLETMWTPLRGRWRLSVVRHADSRRLRAAAGNDTQLQAVGHEHT